jgi:acyl-CoA thioesterase FadM
LAQQLLVLPYSLIREINVILTLRKLQVLATYKFRNQLTSVSEPVVQKFLVLPFDLDENLHMNNGRFINYMEVGRMELMTRTGFLALGLKNNWIAPVASLRIQYLKSLKTFQPFEVKSQILSYDEKWIYIQHTFTSRGKLIALGHIRAVIKGKNGTVKPQSIIDALGLESNPSATAVSPSLHSWFENDQGLLSESQTFSLSKP